MIKSKKKTILFFGAGVSLPSPPPTENDEFLFMDGENFLFMNGDQFDFN